MFVVTVCSFFVLVVLKGTAVETSSPYCDSSRYNVYKEGMIGETKKFAWLGILRVHLHHDKQLRIAVTGIVLIKEGYAIANADDVARIPKRIFKEDSKAMFIPLDETPMYFKTVDYVTHPDYNTETLNTIALIELDPGERTPFPIRPICWPPHSYNASAHLYAAGFTDENRLLEKFVYKLQYVEQDLCKEFYNRAGLTEGMVTPTHYQCGFALNNKHDCVWDNGMALISNATGYWTLIGLGLLGPGCAAPSRFIDLEEYYRWIEAETITGNNDLPDFRKSGFSEGLKHQNTEIEIEDIPIHELLRTGDIPTARKNISSYSKYPFSNWGLYEDDWFITPVNETEIIIHKLSKKLFLGNEHTAVPRRPLCLKVLGVTTIVMGWRYAYHQANDQLVSLSKELNKIGDCMQTSLQLVYRDTLALKAVVTTSLGELQKPGTATYKLSLSDLEFQNYTCVQIKVKSLNQGVASISYTKKVEKKIFEPETPDDVLKYYPITQRTPNTTNKETNRYDVKKKPNMKPNPVKDNVETRDDDTINIYLKIYFVGNAEIDVKVYGISKPIKRDPTTTEASKLRMFS